MKKYLCLLFFVPFFVEAQSVGVKDIPADGDTTIEIKKGKNSDKEFEIITNEDEVAGEAAPLIKDARLNWKTACTEWKNETKDLNKENQILSLSCGKMECTSAAMETTCSSKARYKMKVRVK